MKNVIFDLGGVVFSRDKRLCSNDLLAFWKIIHATPTPKFWLEFDRGTLTWEEMVLTMTDVMQMPYNHCNEILHTSVRNWQSTQSSMWSVATVKWPE